MTIPSDSTTQRRETDAPVLSGSSRVPSSPLFWLLVHLDDHHLLAPPLPPSTVPIDQARFLTRTAPLHHGGYRPRPLQGRRRRLARSGARCPPSPPRRSPRGRSLVLHSVSSSLMRLSLPRFPRKHSTASPSASRPPCARPTPSSRRRRSMLSCPTSPRPSLPCRTSRSVPSYPSSPPSRFRLNLSANYSAPPQAPHLRSSPLPPRPHRPPLRCPLVDTRPRTRGARRAWYASVYSE